jgi:hypothetical protein
MRNEYFVFQFFVDINKKKTAEEYKVKFDKLIALSRQESPERERQQLQTDNEWRRRKVG